MGVEPFFVAKTFFPILEFENSIRKGGKSLNESQQFARFGSSTNDFTSY